MKISFFAHKISNQPEMAYERADVWTDQVGRVVNTHHSVEIRFESKSGNHSLHSRYSIISGSYDTSHIVAPCGVSLPAIVLHSDIPWSRPEYGRPLEVLLIRVLLFFISNVTMNRTDMLCNRSLQLKPLCNLIVSLEELCQVVIDSSTYGLSWY